MPSSELLEIIGPAFVAGLVIAFVHVPLGLEVFRRGIIFIDLAIAQVAGLGIVVISIYMDDPSWWMMQGGALVFAMIAAVFFRWVEKKLPHQQEAIIGSSFVLTASLSLLLLADRPHGGEEIQHLLSGQILFVTWHDVLVHAPIYGGIMALWFLFPNIVRKSAWFFILFALAITSSVQLVGVYVVFASLIMPALAVSNRNNQYVMGWICGLISVISALVISTSLDWPAGPVIVLCYMFATIAIRLLTMRAASTHVSVSTV